MVDIFDILVKVINIISDVIFVNYAYLIVFEFFVTHKEFYDIVLLIIYCIVEYIRGYLFRVCFVN